MIRREISKITEEFRSSGEGLWKRMRELLVEKGLDPATLVLAYTYPEDYQFEYGIIVTKDENVFQYGFDFLHKQISEGTFSEWNDITQKYGSLPQSNEIEAALVMARGAGE